MSALIPPGCAVMQRGEPLHPSTTPWDGPLAAIFLVPEIWNHGFTRMNTDERKKQEGSPLQSRSQFLLHCRLGFFLHFVLSVFIRVNPWFQAGSP
jgi:hypothetical protein